MSSLLDPPTPTRDLMMSPPPLSPAMGGSDSPTLNRRHRELDDIYETYRAEREKERVKLRIPTELLVVVRSLWDPVVSSLAPEHLNPLQMWGHFLRTISRVRPSLCSLSSLRWRSEEHTSALQSHFHLV